MDALDIRNGLSEPKLIFRSRVPALNKVGDIRTGSNVCVAFGETKSIAESGMSAKSRMGLLYHSIEDGMVLCPTSSEEEESDSSSIVGVKWRSSSSFDGTHVTTSSTTTSHHSSVMKGMQTYTSRGSFFDDENRVAISDNVGNLWVVNV